MMLMDGWENVVVRPILVTGASVAGNTAAWWLARFGFEVEIVESATQFRDGGQNIDVRGVGREILRRMGLEQAALDRGTGELGTAWIDADGRVAAKFETSDLGGDGPTAEMEILRGDLARLIYDAAAPHASFRFGDRIEGVADEGDAVRVTFASGARRSYHAVIVAEGVGSATRELVFPGENNPRWMDLTIAYFTIPRAGDDDRFWRWYNAPGGRSVSLRPDTHGTTRAMLSIQGTTEGEEDWPEDRQRAWLHERFAGVGWQAPRVLAGMDASDDFYFDALRQVRVPRWSQGGLALTGDAAWCATPLAGIGTTLAIVGSFVLAGELARHSRATDAFSAYERVMRPIVKKGQGVPKIGPRLMNPYSRIGIGLLHRALAVASRPMVRSLAEGAFSREPPAPDLSRYDALLGDGAAEAHLSMPAHRRG